MGPGSLRKKGFGRELKKRGSAGKIIRRQVLGTTLGKNPPRKVKDKWIGGSTSTRSKQPELLEYQHDELASRTYRK